MPARNIKKGLSGPSAHGLRDFCAEVEEYHSLTVMAENKPGVPARVVAPFSCRSYGIESLPPANLNHRGQRIRTVPVARNASATIGSDCIGSVS